MLCFFQPRALRALAAVTVLSVGGLACADSRYDRVASGGAQYIYRGQSAVIVTAPAAREDAPYALTGNRETVRDELWNSQGHWINAGQARVYVPATR